MGIWAKTDSTLRQVCQSGLIPARIGSRRRREIWKSWRYSIFSISWESLLGYLLKMNYGCPFIGKKLSLKNILEIPDLSRRTLGLLQSQRQLPWRQQHFWIGKQTTLPCALQRVTLTDSHIYIVLGQHLQGDPSESAEWWCQRLKLGLESPDVIAGPRQESQCRGACNQLSGNWRWKDSKIPLF